jgi:hypothetical protein
MEISMRVVFTVSAVLLFICSVTVTAGVEDDSRRILGGYTPIDVKDEIIKEMANFAVSKLSQASNSLGALTISRIISAESQVVAGFNYDLELELEVGSSSSNNKHFLKCHVIVFDQSW